MAMDIEYKSNLKPFNSNGDVSKWKKKSWLDRKTSNKHTFIRIENIKQNPQKPEECRRRQMPWNE